MATKRHTIAAEFRSDTGKGASRRLRRADKVPAVLYGGDREPVNLQFDHETLLLAASNQWFFSSVLDLQVGEKKQAVLVRDWQMHPYKRRMLHLDFVRIDEKAEIRVNVPLNFMNEETSPAGKASDVMISHHLNEVEVACLSKDLPAQIDVDLAELENGTILHLSDLVLPEGVALTQLRLGEEHDDAVVSAQTIVAEEEPADDDVEGAGEAGESESDTTKSDDEG